MLKISNAVASSVCNGIADDALKDEDNGLWLASLPSQIQAVWKERFSWIRWVDRLAEQDYIVCPGGRQFSEFYQAWERLRSRGYLPTSDHTWKVLRQIESVWFLDGAVDFHRPEIEAWDCYMNAIVDYHQPDLTVATLEEYELMLDRLAGACFQLLPFLNQQHQAIARQFGVVDQFYNNLRDLYEDSRQGVCYFPTEVLQRFGITRQEILDLSCFEKPGYPALMQFWVDTYLRQLRRRKMALVLAQDLHPSWQCLTDWFIHRYIRIEQVLRDCQYNFVTFSQQYWQVVYQDLNHHMVKERQRRHLNQCRPLVEPTEIASFLEVHPSTLSRRSQRAPAPVGVH